MYTQGPAFYMGDLRMVEILDPDGDEVGFVLESCAEAILSHLNRNN